MIFLRRRTELLALRVTQPGQSQQATRPVEAAHCALAGIRAVALPVEAAQMLNVYTQLNAPAGNETQGYTVLGAPLNAPLTLNANATNWLYLAVPVGSGWPFGLVVGGNPVTMEERGVYQIAQAPGKWYRVYRYYVGAGPGTVAVTLTVSPATGFNLTNWGRLFVSHQGRSASLELRRMDLGVSPELFLPRDQNLAGAPMLTAGWPVNRASDSVLISYRDDDAKNFGFGIQYDVLAELVWVLRNPAVDLLPAAERGKVYRWFLDLNRDGLPVEDLNQLVKTLPDSRAWMQ